MTALTGRMSEPDAEQVSGSSLSLLTLVYNMLSPGRRDLHDLGFLRKSFSTVTGDPIGPWQMSLLRPGRPDHGGGPLCRQQDPDRDAGKRQGARKKKSS